MQGQSDSVCEKLVGRHLTAGWSLVVLFVLLGTALEMLHGFKVGWYLDVSNATRRLMWTLAHAHGALLGLVNLGFAATLRARALPARSSTTASACLLASSALLPGGFFLGGLKIYGGDPGLGVYLTPFGALFLAIAGVIVLGAVRGAPPRAPAVVGSMDAKSQKSRDA